MALAGLVWTGAAFSAALLHVVIDYHIGLYGEHSADMTLFQAAAAVAVAVLFGMWALLMGRAATGDPDALRSLFWFVVVEAVLLNGALGFLAAPPPADAFPYQDLAHAASLATGVMAARHLRRQLLDVVPAGGGGCVPAPPC